MSQTTKDTWTRAHDLALIFIALAYGTDQDLSDEELETITETLTEWREEGTKEDIQEVVMEAVAIYLEANAGREVDRSIQSLKEKLDAEDRRRALEDFVRIAEADGVLLSTEQSLISRLASAWEIRGTSERLIDRTTVTVEEEPDWSLLHDIGLMYVVLAHSSTEDLSDEEIAAMIDRLSDWQPELSEEEIRAVLREALTFYAHEPDREALQQSIDAIHNYLPLLNRLVLIDDLVHIAKVDGPLNDYERSVLNNLSRTWDVGIRTNGPAEA